MHSWQTRRLAKLRDNSFWLPVSARPYNHVVDMEDGFLMTIAVAIASEHNQFRWHSELHDGATTHCIHPSSTWAGVVSTDLGHDADAIARTRASSDLVPF